MSPILFCFFFLLACRLNLILCNTSIACLPQERDALLSFRNEMLDGSGLPSPSVSWEGLNCCEWHGVQCSTRTSHVIQLHLSPSTVLLNSYWMYCNTYLSRSLSPALFKLKHLQHLDLSFNCLTRTIPQGLSALTHLTHLDLSNNFFHGEIPKAIASLLNLTYLNLHEAGFYGIVPSQLGNLSHLQFLDLSSNWLNPNFEWTRNLLRLKHLSLQGVDFSISGEQFWEHISHLRDLNYLDVSACWLSGPIPTAILNLTSLAHLFLSSNMFSSQIPSWLGNLTRLHSLWLSVNDFDGPFPLSLSRLPALQELRMSHLPLLSGDLSEILGGEWPHLAIFSLSESKITGILPSSVGNISSLTSLDLRDMAIEGSIPSSIGNLSALENLEIYFTSLNGTIPASLGRLSSLGVLDLQNNQLSGNIPGELGKLPSLQLLDLGTNQLQEIHKNIIICLLDLMSFIILRQRYLKHYDEVELSALGKAIATVVTVAEILKNTGMAVEKRIMTTTVDIKDETRRRPIQEAKVEIILGKSHNFELMDAAEEKVLVDGEENNKQ